MPCFKVEKQSVFSDANLNMFRLRYPLQWHSMMPIVVLFIDIGEIVDHRC
jgi:hypothetical protein